jgi:hypothetical protein
MGGQGSFQRINSHLAVRLEEVKGEKDVKNYVERTLGQKEF